MSEFEMLYAFKDRFQLSYQRYVANYKNYLKMRGYGDHMSDWFFIKRGFLECWLEPGFHRFWRLWNPGIGYFAYRLYIIFGGKRRKTRATLAAFVLNGLIHNLAISLLLWRWDFPLPFTFLSFGIFTITFKFFDQHVKLERMPKVFHLVVNIVLVIVSFDFGFAMNDLLK